MGSAKATEGMSRWSKTLSRASRAEPHPTTSCTTNSVAFKMIRLVHTHQLSLQHTLPVHMTSPNCLCISRPGFHVTRHTRRHKRADTRDFFTFHSIVFFLKKSSPACRRSSWEKSEYASNAKVTQVARGGCGGGEHQLAARPLLYKYKDA